MRRSGPAVPDGRPRTAQLRGQTCSALAAPSIRGRTLGAAWSRVAASVIAAVAAAFAFQHVIVGAAPPSFRITSLELPGIADWVVINNAGNAAATYSPPTGGRRPILIGSNEVIQLTSQAVVGSLDLNERGQVVGAFLNPRGAFLWDNGELTNLGFLPGGTASVPQALNEHGQVVGNGNSPTGSRAILWDKGTLRDLGTLPGALGQFPFSGANGVNNSGTIVGLSGHPSGFDRAVLWTPNGMITDLGLYVVKPMETNEPVCKRDSWPVDRSVRHV